MRPQPSLGQKIVQFAQGAARTDATVKGLVEVGKDLYTFSKFIGPFSGLNINARSKALHRLQGPDLRRRQ